MGSKRLWKGLAVACSALLCVALVPTGAFEQLAAMAPAPAGALLQQAGLQGSGAEAQAAPTDEGIASEDGGTAVTFAQLKEQTADEGYRESVDYVAGKAMFAVRDVRDEGAQPQRLGDGSALCREAGLTDVTFVYESKSKTAQVEAGKAAYDVYYEASIEGDDVWAAVDALNARDEVLYAEPDITWENTAVGGYTEATAEEVHEAWQLDAIGAKDAWQKSYQLGINPGQGAVVAVIDTGVDYDHIDLTNSMWKNDNESYDGQDDDGDGYVDDVFGVNLITGTGDPQDDQGHGTHVAGIIAAQAGNGGSVGVAYGAQIMAIKAGQSTGSFASSDIAKGIRYAVDHGADVINMSFGGTGRSAVVEAALADAYSTCVLVAAAGNDGLPTSEAADAGYNRYEDVYPAGYSYVLGVMSCDGNGDGSLSSFSNWDFKAKEGCEYELIAPGENVYSTLPGNRYAKWSGTSMAAPEVSAAAAIVRSINTDKSRYTSRYIMGQLSSATDKIVSYTGRLGDYHESPKLDAIASLEKTPTPDLSIVETYLFDSPSISPKNNGDGIVQPGETIDMGVVVRNQWGIATNVQLTADAMSDMGVASPYITFESDIATIQDIGTFATANNGFIHDDGVPTGVSKPIRFIVSEDGANDMELTINLHIQANNGMNPNDEELYVADSGKTFIVQKGQTLHGILKEDTTLTSDKLWIVDSSLLVPEGITLTIDPGTQVKFWSSDASNPYANTAIPYIQVEGRLVAEGTQEKPISLTLNKGFEQYGVCITPKPENAYQTNNAICDADYSAAYVRLSYVTVQNPCVLYNDTASSNPYLTFSATEVDHCRFIQTTTNQQDLNHVYVNQGEFDIRSLSSSVVSDLYPWSGSNGPYISKVQQSLITRSAVALNRGGFGDFETMSISRSALLLNPDHTNYDGEPSGTHFATLSKDDLFRHNAVLNNLNDYTKKSWMNLYASLGHSAIDVSGCYWGTDSSDLVKWQVIDADSDVSLNDLVQEPFLTLDSPELETIYPFVTEAFVTDMDGNRLDDVSGAQEVQVHVKFNRDMDAATQPMVTYGPAEPYTDYAVYGDWKTAREWVGAVKIDPFIDQGNEFFRIKDAAAADDTWLKTGTDAGRFKFNVSKVGAAAMTLQGSAEDDGVHLSWKQDDYDTLAGYNVYRATSYDKEQPASEQGFQKANNAIVPATVGEDGDIATYGVFADSAVDPVTDYYYYFTVVDTQFHESEPSNVVKATTQAIDLSGAVVSVDDQTYTGSNVCPAPTVVLNGKYLTRGTDYTVSFADNQRPGTATLTITGKGDYCGQASATFDIVCGHTLDSQMTVEPTCEDFGNRHYTCSTCGYEYDEAISPLGHDSVEDEAVAAMCDVPGKKAGSHCSRCGEVLQPQQVVPALGHAFVMVGKAAATCTEPGRVDYACTRCDATKAVETAALGHVEVVDEGVAATCTEHGLTAGSHCSRCGDVITEQQETPLADHVTVADPAVPATCTAPGKTEGSHCSVCGQVIVAQQTVPALGHEWAAKTTEADCAHGGFTEATCTRCGASRQYDYTRPTAHVYNRTVAQEPTCEQAGLAVYTCAVCGDSYSEIVPATGHSAITDPAVEATCDAPGKTSGSHCSACGKVLSDQQEVPALGHSYVMVGKSASTCEAAGRIDYACTRCDAVKSTELAPLGHAEVVDEAISATCTEPGLTAGSHCSRCGEVLVAQEQTPLVAHQVVVDAAIEATCTAHGKTEGSHCGVCGEILVAQQPTALAEHSPVVDVAVAATCTLPGKTEGSHCSVCGQVLVAQQETALAAHTPVADPAVPATCTSPGKTEGSHCSVCGKVLTAQQTVPALGHEWEAETIDADCAHGGFTEATCARCGATRQYDYTRPTTHAYNRTVAVEPTCEQAGLAVYTCAACGDSYSAAIPALGHIATIDPAVPATCDAPGKTEGSHCSACGKVLSAQQEVPALGHSYTAVGRADATCTEAGHVDYACTRCGNKKSDELTPLGHSAEIDPAVPATCDAPGKTAGSHCSRCGEVVEPQQVVPALGHAFVMVGKAAATCSEPGRVDYACTRCDATKAVETAALGHVEVVDEGVAATCTEHGLTAGSHCGRCGDVITEQQETPLAPHTPVTDPVVPATCIAAGKTEGSHCSVCGEIIIAQQETELGEHVVVTDPSVPATCTSPGKTEGSHCSVCSQVIVAQQTVPALGHEWAAKTTEADCAHGGFTEATCTRCGASRQYDYTRPTAHVYNRTVAQEPTCEQAGLAVYTCAACGDSYSEAIPATGHAAAVDPAVAATCTTHGKTEGTHCATCGKVLVAQKETPLADHKVVTDPAVPATCDTPGKTVGSHCATCGKVLTAQKDVSALGHAFADAVTAPTCSANGFTTHTCSRCGYSYTSDYTRPIAHSFVSKETKAATCTEDGVRTYTCTACGFSYEETTIAVGHDWGEWMVKQMPTTEAKGLMERSCNTCGAVEDKDVSKLDPEPAPDPDPTPDPGVSASLGRLAGNEAADTSAKIALETFPEGCEWVVVARDDDFADAMSATGLAGTLNAPIVLTDRNGLSDAARDAVLALHATKAYVIGGKGAIPADLEGQLGAIGCNVVDRVFGDDSWDTSVACADKIAYYGGNQGGNAIVAMSTNFQDALSISSFAYKYQVPIFLETAKQRKLPVAARKAINKLSGTIYVPGGPGAVPTDSVEGVFGADRVQRIFGNDGYDTSNQIAAYMVQNGLLSASTVCIANGAEDLKGVDALAGAALAGRAGGVMLLANDNAACGDVNGVTIAGADSAGTSAFLTTRAGEVSRAYVLGGAYVMPEGFYSKIAGILG